MKPCSPALMTTEKYGSPIKKAKFEQHKMYGKDGAVEVAESKKEHLKELFSGLQLSDLISEHNLQIVKVTIGLELFVCHNRCLLCF